MCPQVNKEDIAYHNEPANITLDSCHLRYIPPDLSGGGGGGGDKYPLSIDYTEGHRNILKVKNKKGLSIPIMHLYAVLAIFQRAL